MASSFHKVGVFAKLSNYIFPSLNKLSPKKLTIANDATQPKKSLESFIPNSKSRAELISAVKSLQNYSSNTKDINERRKRLFKLMSWRQQNICNDIGYSAKLKKIDQAVIKNQKLLNDISSHAKTKYKIKYNEFSSHSPIQLESTNNYRVIEALGHYIRDWCKEGEIELKPLLSYITNHLNSIIPAEERSKTCIVVPGSGLGKIAHKVALIGKEDNNQFGSVEAVDFSWLMNLCNDFVYKPTEDTESSITEKDEYEIYPYVHTCSNHTSTSNQLRTACLKKLEKPSNLSLHYCDFRYFKIPEASKYENVVILSAFFLDTAENLMDYLDHISKLSTPNINNNIKNGYWINIGPLKYGTAAQVQFNLEEFRLIREKIGWSDLNENSFNHKYTAENYKSKLSKNEYITKELVGYLTDTESLWQGFYGLGMWCSERKENKNPIN